MKKNKRFIFGGTMLEFAIVIIPFIIFTFGSIEFLWFINLREAMVRAGNQAVRDIYLTKKKRNVGQIQKKMQAWLISTGYNKNTASQLLIEVQTKSQTGVDLVSVSLPINAMFLFGSFTKKIYSLSLSSEKNYKIIVLRPI